MFNIINITFIRNNMWDFGTLGVRKRVKLHRNPSLKRYFVSNTGVEMFRK